MKVTLLTLICVVALVVSGGLGCPPGKRLAFDLNATLEASKRLNMGYLDCLCPEADGPCFYFKHVFSPYFVVEDMVLEGSERFLGSYTFKVVGGGPESRSNIRYYSEEEIRQYNSFSYRTSQNNVIWVLEDMADSVHLTEEGFVVMDNTSNRIRWLCQRNSPCGDLTPRGLHDPDFFFIVEVSNKGINNSDCEDTVRFELHLHGFPLSAPRALFYMMMTITTILILLVCYVVYACCGPSRTDDTEEDSDEEDGEDHEEQSSVCAQQDSGLLVNAGWIRQSWVLKLYHIMFSITQSTMLDYFLLVLVLVDIGLLVAQSFQGVTEGIGWFLSALEACFVAIYLMDVVLKMLVLGCSYFRDPWNDLDLVIVLMSVVDITLSLVESASGYSGGHSSAVFRVLKLFRGARAMRAFHWLRMIRFFQTVRNVLRSFRSMGAIFGNMFVFLLLFAVIFREMFSVSDPQHFGNMFKTIFTLFQVLTLDDWSLVSAKSRENGAPHIAFFLTAYIIVEYFTFLNLFIAVLVDNFQLISCKQSTDSRGDKTESPEETIEADMSQSEIVEEFYKEALRHSLSSSEHSKRKVELITRYLDLMAVIDQQQQKYRSLACLQDQLVEDFFKIMEE